MIALGVLLGACASAPLGWLREPPPEETPPTHPVAALEAARAAGLGRPAPSPSGHGDADGELAAWGEPGVAALQGSSEHHGAGLGDGHSAAHERLVTPLQREARSIALAMHVASYRDQAHAVRGWGVVRAAAPEALAGLRARVETAEIRGETYYRLKAGPARSVAEAERRCGLLSAAGLYCRITDFSGQALAR